MEERHKDSELGYALCHLPSGKKTVNRAWMWSAYLATNLSVFIQSLGQVDTSGRAHAKRARRELFCLAARVRGQVQVYRQRAPRCSTYR